MAKKRNKPTPMQQSFKKEVARIKRSIRNIEKRGYFFQELPNLELPKRVTKQALTKLQNTKAKELYTLTVKVDTDTGEFIAGVEARQQEYKERAQKAKQTRKQRKQPKPQQDNRYRSIDDYTQDEIDQFPDFSDIIISNFKSELSQFPPEVKKIFNAWLDETTNIYGASLVAEQIAEAKERGLIDYSVYGSDAEMAKYVVSNMTKALPNFTQERQDKLTEAMEFIEDWNGLIEG